MKARRRHRLTTKRRLVGLFVGTILCLSGFAFTATLTVTTSKAADGAGVIANSTFSIASVQYQLDSNTPTQIANVVVTFSGTAPNDVRASIGGTWSNACSASGVVFTCTFSSEPSFPMNNSTVLRVVATS